MDSAHTLIIAGIRIAINCEHEGLSQALSRKYQPFFTRGDAAFQVKVTWDHTASLIPFITPEISFQKNTIQLSSAGFSGSGDFTRKLGELIIEVENPLDAVDYFIRVIFALLAYEAGGIMVHGAGILHKGSGYLFCGHSGSGKTTISRSSVNEEVLNDDLVVLLPDENLWRMYSTPFWNPTQVVPKQLGAVLTAIYYLIQDESVYAEPMKPGQALAELIANIPIISGNPDHSIGLIERGKEVFRQVPAYRLHFLPDDSFWRVIDNRSG